MTQGYGPDNGQQGQWGQDPQAPQWGQQDPQGQWGQDPQWGQAGQDTQWGPPEQQAPDSQPQWGQATPAPQHGSPMTSPSQPAWSQASPAVPSAVRTAPTRLMKWLYFGALAVVAARGLYLLCNIITTVTIVGLAPTASNPGGLMAVAVLLLLLALIGVVILSVGLLVLAIIVAVKAEGRGRTGAIIIGGAVLLSVVAYLATRGIFFALQSGAEGDFDALTTLAITEFVVIGVHWLAFAAAVIVGAVMARRWARQNA